MNRRGFIAAIAAAPVAIPIAVKGAVTSRSDLIFGEAILGESMTFEPLAPLDPFDPMAAPQEYLAKLRDEVLRLRGLTRSPHPCSVEPDPFVAGQMAEHDLFESFVA